MEQAMPPTRTLVSRRTKDVLQQLASHEPRKAGEGLLPRHQSAPRGSVASDFRATADASKFSPRPPFTFQSHA